MNHDVRTRFAPSPTGFMHVGGIRTALFAYLVAQQTGGQFVVRLEDTDQNREVEGSAQHILDCLRVLGLTYDEGPDIGGPFKPYKQSERLDIYKKWAQILIDSGRAYIDPHTPSEVQAFREQAQKEKRAFLYRHHRPESADQPVTAWDGSRPLRFKSDPKPYQWHDEVMGDLSSSPEVIDDFILIKSDGFPTYNFAHIVDDAEMQITHVIRGQEFLASMPNYLNLYEALGFDTYAKRVTSDGAAPTFDKISNSSKEGADQMTGPADNDLRGNSEGISNDRSGEKILKTPIFATLPHIMNEHGNKKLGKRDGAKDVLDYIQEGFLPEALISFIATLGWNDGTTQEFFTRAELIEKFSLSRVQKSGARFDKKRLEWVNGQFIRQISTHQIDQIVGNDTFWPSAAQDADPAFKQKVFMLAKDRLKTLHDLRLFDYFFITPQKDENLIKDNKQLKKLTPDEIADLLRQSRGALQKVEDWTPENIQIALNALLETAGQKPAILFSLIRVYTTWAPFSPQLSDTLALLGKQTTLERLA